MTTPPHSTRFTPTRAGVINLWDYRDEEFVFVNGWLVLRGPNGSGKTKALEVLFPFVLDGRIEPRRLNPFASEDRTMKSNLLYRGQEVSHGYVWMEFTRPVEAGPAEYVTIGIGLRAHRHVDRVTRWHFVTEGRVGVDFSLLDADDRPLTRKDLAGQVRAEDVHEIPEEYRRAVDARLFGLGVARYEQMLDLVLTLRKPQLAKDLNPAELSRTLQRGLRPLDDALIIEAAGSFDDMEAVARTLEGLIAADQATTGFLSVYSTYLRTHARAAADALTARRATVQERHADLHAADQDHRHAEENLARSSGRVALAEAEPGRLRAHLNRLRSSTAYQSHEQLADLERHVQDLAGAAGRAQADLAREHASVQIRHREADGARSHTEDAAAEVGRLLREVAVETESAGIGWSAEDAGAEGFGARITARITARHDDVRTLRHHLASLADTDREHGRATAALSAAEAATSTAQQAETAAEAAAATARDQVRAALSIWLEAYTPLLGDLDAVDAPAALSAAVERIGDPDAPTLRDVLAAHAAPGATRVRERTATLAVLRTNLRGRRTEVIAQRERISAEHDDAPASAATRTADRSLRPGAPLWRLVRFADDLDTAHAAGLEAALEATGLLDAWIHPDPAGGAAAVRAIEADGYLRSLPAPRRPAGLTLAGYLIAEDQAYVPAAAIDAVLASIAVRDTAGQEDNADPATITTAGQYTHGILLGAYGKSAPEYIGATARAARRAARIAECDLTIAGLEAEIATAEYEADALRCTLAAIESATTDLPPGETVLRALRELDRAATALRLRHEAEIGATARLDHAVAEQSAASSALRRAAAERALPADRVEGVSDALRRLETAVSRVDPAHRALLTAQSALAAAQNRHIEATERHADAQSHAHEAAMRHEEKREEFQTLSDAVDDADVHRVLAEVADTERRVEDAEAHLVQLRTDLATAVAERAAAATRAQATESALRLAAIEAQHESLRLRPFAHADLLGLLRCAVDLRWPAQLPQEPSDALPEQVAALHDAILEATRELSPTESSLKQSATRLSTALTDLQAQLPAAGLDHRPEWDTDDGVIVVRIADEQGLTPVAHFAERIARERHDQEQLLSDSERRILEDALLTQLARQIHHRTVESRDLVDGMDAQMRARRMSSGLTIGVGWHLSDDLDAERREICKLLERDPARLGPAQLATLRRHFATRIKSARAMAPELPYRDLLSQVLDYRAWRTFKFTLYRPGGAAEALTRARHSQLSGGEQSVSLHLPLFAAANALFASARSQSPRILGLDEAFAGVDENGRGELMSLASQFDLDLFMTGFDLWATHPTVAGAAHYDLSHSAVEHAVSTILMVWNGTTVVADFDGTLPAALGSPETRRAPAVGTIVGEVLELETG